MFPVSIGHILLCMYVLRVLMYQVVFGDQAICKTIRGAKHWSQTEIRDQGKDTLKWDEVTGTCIIIMCTINFYPQQSLAIGIFTCLQVIIDAFWGNITTPGFICSLREYIHHVQLDKQAKSFCVADEFVLKGNF